MEIMCNEGIMKTRIKTLDIIMTLVEMMMMIRDKD